MIHRFLALNKYVQLLIITVFLVVLDQSTKIWIRATIHESGPIQVIPGFFRLVHVENEGAAWGILSDAAYRMPFFIVTTLVAFTVIGVYYSKLDDQYKVLRLALSTILGGAIGNFIDRMVQQSVTDFLDFYISYRPLSSWLIQTMGTNRWPSFNVADVAIVVGLILVMYDSFVLENQRLRAQKEAQATSPTISDVSS